MARTHRPAPESCLACRGGHLGDLPAGGFVVTTRRACGSRSGRTGRGATDGAVDVLQHLGLDNWPAIAADPTQASRLLHRASVWEAYADPDGHQLPRAKRHDDKTLAVIRELQTCPPYVLHASD